MLFTVYFDCCKIMHSLVLKIVTSAFFALFNIFYIINQGKNVSAVKT